MPLFEYRCRRCEAAFEELLTSRSAAVACPRCGAADVAKLLSRFAVGTEASGRPVEAGPCGACGAPERGSCGAG